MSGRGLLGRLAGATPSAIDPVTSIVGHLRALLNARRGDAVTVPGFGILDFVDVVHDASGGAQQLARSIRQTVLEYEPRLRHVAVRHVPGENALQLRFEITAHVAEGRGTRTLRFATTVRPGGRVDVSG